MSQPVLQEERFLVRSSDKSRVGYFSFEMPMDGIFMAVTFFVLYTILSPLPYLPFWGPQVIPLAVVALLIYRVEDGRLYYVYGYLLPTGFWIWNKRGIVWSPSSWRRTQKILRYLPRNIAHGLEEWLAPISFKVDGIQRGEETLGIAHNEKTKLDTFVVVAEGSPFAHQEMMAKLNEVFQHGEVIKRNAITPLFKVRWSYVFQRSPFDPYDLLDTYDRSLDHSVYFPPSRLKPESEWTVEDRVDQFLNSVARASLDDADAAAAKVTMAVVVTIERKGELYKQKRTTELADDELSRTPVLDLERGIVSDLEHIARVKNPRSLSQEELALYMREAWDSTDIREYYLRFHKNQRKQLTEEERSEFAHSHWPSKQIWAGSGRSQVDNTHVAVLKITSNPEEIPPDFWHKVMRIRYTRQAEPVWITVTFCGETVSLKGEAFALSRGIPLIRAFRNWAMNAAYQSQESKDRDASMVDRHTTIYRDQNYQLANVRLIKIRAASKESLARAIDVVKIEMSKSSLRGRVIKRRKLQLAALWSAAGIPLL